jgi:hypothetical protein
VLESLDASQMPAKTTSAPTICAGDSVSPKNTNAQATPTTGSMHDDRVAEDRF